MRSLDSSRYSCCAAINGQGDFRDTLLSEGISVLNLPLGDYHSAHKTVSDMARIGLRTLFCARELANYCHRHPCDLLWANGPRTFAAAALAGRVTGRPVVWHLHIILTSRSEVFWLLFFSKWVRRVIVCSRAVAASLIDTRPRLESKIRLLYNPHPDWDWPSTIIQSSGLRSKFGLGKKDFLIGILGRLTPFKGQKVFLKAAEKVARELPQTRFFVIGSPSPNDRADITYQTDLRRLSYDMTLEDRVFFLPYQSSVRQYIESLDAVVMASIGPEALPQILIEAMFLGKPVIAPSQGGILEMFEDFETGLFYTLGDEEALARKMIDLVQSPDSGAKLGLRARQKVLEKFSRAGFREGIAEELARCLGEA